MNNFKLFTLIILGATTLSSCGSGTKPSDETIECDRLTINLDPKFYDEVINNSPRPKTVVLKEDDNTLFAEARKVMVRNDKIFVLDPIDGRTAVSFTMDGKPYAHYGRTGNGPGEYIRPWDMDVDSTGVYILDSNHKKVLKYSHKGDFIKDFDIPFFSFAFALLDGGRFLFNLPEDGTAAPQLCVTDSTVTDLKYHLNYKDGQEGGWSTDNAINKTPWLKTFYKAPAYTIFILNRDGEPSGGIILDFNGKDFSEEAKLNFESYSDRDRNNGAIMLLDNPFPLPNGLWVGAVEDKDKRYSIIFDPVKNLCGGRDYGRNSTRPNSVFDMFWLCGSDEDGNPISLLENFALEYCNDIDSLDEKAVEALRNGNRVLVFYNLKHPGE